MTERKGLSSLWKSQVCEDTSTELSQNLKILYWRGLVDYPTYFSDLSGIS